MPRTGWIVSLVCILFTFSSVPTTAAVPPTCRYHIAAIAPQAGDRLHLDVNVRCSGIDANQLAPRKSEVSAYLDTLMPEADSLALTRDNAGNHIGGYRLYLGELATQQHGDRELSSYGQAYVATLPHYIIPPEAAPRQLQIELEIRTPPGITFATALPKKGDVYQISMRDFYYSGYTIWGAFALTEIPLPSPGSLEADAFNAGQKTNLQVVMFGDAIIDKQTLLMDWIRDMARHTAAFWDGFPAENALLFLEPVNGESTVPFGMVRAGGGATIMLKVGTNVGKSYLYEDDWVLLHEFSHLGIPFVTGRRPWFMEGMATYLEPLIRARTGLRSEGSVWREWFRGMPVGVRGLRSRGLNRGGNPYWGGAIYFLTADLEIRKASRGHLGIEDCLKGVRRQIGNATIVTQLQPVLAACDAAVGNNLASTLADRYGNNAVSIDLDDLWRRLGVHREGRIVHYNNSSALAYVRDTLFRGHVAWREEAAPRRTQ